MLKSHQITDTIKFYGGNMDIIKFLYEHWILTSWFIMLFNGTTFVKYIKKIKS